MDKLAQKYKNPERERISQLKEKLFSDKKEWNHSIGNFQKQLSLFQKELRRVKNLINGRVDGKEKLKLHQPLPEDSLSALDALKEKAPPGLASQLEGGKEIVKEQYLYSKEYNNFYSGLEQKRIEKQKQAKLETNSILINGMADTYFNFVNFYNKQ